MRPARFEIARHFDAVVDFEPAAEAVAHVCLDQHRISLPAASIASCLHIFMKRIRFSSDPPYSSRRRFVYGDRNWLIR